MGLVGMSEWGLVRVSEGNGGAISEVTVSVQVA